MKTVQELVLAAQAIAIGSFFIAIVASLTTQIVSLLSLLLLACLLWLFQENKALLKDDFHAYLSFFSILIITSLMIPLVQAAFPVSIYQPFNFIYGLSLLLGFIAGSLLLWRKRYGRNYCYGTVLLSEGTTAVVSLAYDLRSGVREGKYVVTCRKKSKKGATVKVAVVGRMGAQKTPVEVVSNG